jgi:DNA-binding winged helix-turn-helix (wHTH) protein
MKLRFGNLSFDTRRRLLYRGVEPVHLSPKAFQLLSLLLERRPEAVSKSEILEALWPGAAAPEGNLGSVVSEVRHALGDEARGGTWVRTLHGFGYAFEGAVRPLPDVSRHFLVRGRQEIELAQGRNLLGRDREATVRLGHLSVSHEHASILVRGDQAVLEDLAGERSTFRGANVVVDRVVLEDGDVIRVGAVTLAYRILPATKDG